MTGTVGTAALEITASNTGLKTTVEESKRSIFSLGETSTTANAKSSASIDRYVKKLEGQNATLGMSARETERYKLTLRGASEEQLKAADSAIRLKEAYEKGERIGDRIRTGFLALGAAAATGLVAAYVAFDQLVKKAGDFQDMAEKTGDTAENIASLAVAAGTAGVEMDTVVGASEKLTKALTGVDDDSKAAGAAIVALGLNLKEFKNFAPADQIEAVGKALNGFEDGATKTAVAMALFGKAGGELLPFLKELGAQGGRQVILTEEQIQLADDYSDKQARLRTEISLHAQGIATNLLPAYNELSTTIRDLIKDQGFAATATEILKGAMNGGIVVFQTVAVLASEIGYAFLATGREIGAVSVQLVSLAHLDFSGFRAISNAVKEDGERARAELEKFQAKIMSVGQPSAPEAPADYSNEGRTHRPPARPQLQFNGANKAAAGGKNTAAQEAKAQVNYDLDQIRKQSAAITDTFANAEKIMSARRSAGLIDEREYYDAKLGFLALNAQEQESALQKEIARLQQEKLAGKDKIDNARKVVDAEAKLAKVREGATANVQILAIQQEAALQKIEQGYRDAEAAAQDYLDTIRKTQARELAGMGAGTLERGRTDGRAQIEDKYSQQEQSLNKSRTDAEFAGTFGPEAKNKYDDELSRIRRFQSLALGEYDTYFTERLKKENDWSVGASEAMQNYYDESRNIARQTEDLFTNAFKGMEDALTTFITTGKISFSGLANSILADLARIEAKKLIASLTGGSDGAGLLGSALGWIGALSGGGSGASLSGDSSGSLLSATGEMVRGRRAGGGTVSSNGMYEVNEKGPELLNVAGRQYLMMGSQNGSVTPNSEVGNVGGGGPSPTIIVNMHGGGSAPDVRRAAGQGAREALAAFQQAQRYT